MPRNALFASIVLVLAVTAAVVSFVEGNWFGVVWVLMAGVSSNIAWFYIRKDRLERARADQA
jgi:hypothetical protein